MVSIKILELLDDSRVARSHRALDGSTPAWFRSSPLRIRPSRILPWHYKVWDALMGFRLQRVRWLCAKNFQPAVRVLKTNSQGKCQPPFRLGCDMHLGIIFDIVLARRYAGTHVATVVELGYFMGSRRNGRRAWRNQVSPGRGAFCGAFPQEWLIHPVLLLFILQRETLLQVIEVRRILEVKAIALAAKRAPPEDLAETF